MKNIIRLILAFLPAMTFAQSIIINHNNTDFNSLNKSKVEQCISKLKVAYQHTSHGSQLVTGLNALEKFNSSIYTYVNDSYNLKTGAFFNDYAMPDAGDLGHSGDINWATATETLLSNPECDKNVIMWSWCGGCSDNTVEGINTYLNKMSELEAKYPNVTFVYMTGHLDGSGKDGNLNAINTIIRDFCAANNKVLFDFADIESYAPNGTDNLMEKYANDACEYDSNGDSNTDANWADQWIAANPTESIALMATDCEECAHSHKLNCIRKGIATWNLLSAIANRGTSRVEADSVLPNNNEIVKLYPNPITADKQFTIEYKLKETNFVKIDIFDTNGHLVQNVLNGVKRSAGNHPETISVENLLNGKYEIRLLIGDECITKSFVIVR